MQNEMALRTLATALVVECEYKPLLLLADLSNHFGFAELAESLVEHAESCLDALFEYTPVVQPHEAYLNQCAAMFGLPPYQVVA